MSEADYGTWAGDIVLEEVPASYEVPGFARRYQAYLERGRKKAVMDVRCHGFFSWIWNALGTALCVVGGAVMIFGPSSVQVPYGGMSLWQAIQIYPGFVLTLGAVVLVVGNAVKPPAERVFMTPELYLLFDWRIKMPDGSACGRALSVTYLENDRFQIGFGPLQLSDQVKS